MFVALRYVPWLSSCVLLFALSWDVGYGTVPGTTMPGPSSRPDLPPSAGRNGLHFSLRPSSANTVNAALKTFTQRQFS